MNSAIKIQNRCIGGRARPFIVAELSGNHSQCLDTAKRLIDAAAEAGADAVKLQTYTADAMTLNSAKEAFMVRSAGAQWEGQKLYELYQQAHTPYEWHAPLFKHSQQRGIICFSTPFDIQGVELLESLGAPMHKIASFELTHHPLLERVAKTGKPVVMSTGMATENEISAAVNCLRAHGCEELILLKCTSAYPAKCADANLRTMPALAQRFQCLSGLSDHTLGTTVAVAATALGACFIEKHITLDRNDGGVDSSFSLEPQELSELVHSVHQAHAALGEVQFAPTDSELGPRKYRRSLYAKRPIAKGEYFSQDNIAIVRPTGGLAPRYYPEVLGKRALQDIDFAEPILAECVENSALKSHSG